MRVLAEETLAPAEKRVVDQAIAAHDERPGALLSVLEAVQSAAAHRYLSQASLQYIADKAGLPRARVYSAASFFALFNLVPQGENVICICRGTACHTRNSRDLLERVCVDLGVGASDAHALGDADKLSLTTADRKFTIRTVACFGQCALAPVVEVNHHVLSHVNERTLEREIKALTDRRD